MNMQNSPELNGKYLGQITQDFVKVADWLKEASYQVRVRKISDYPIFVMCRESPQIGQILYEKGTNDLDWNYSFSFLAEFIERKLIENEASENFILQYKDPDEYCCLFVVEKDFLNFVYIPYPED